MPYEELLVIASTIASMAGHRARHRRIEGVEVAATKSSPVDVVTAADREVEALIRSALAAERPNDGFLGEESGVDVGSSGLTWVVDPIDGTVNYLYGIPHYAVSIAVVEGDADPLTWTALAGCVLNPVSGELFSASAGGGAHLGTTPIRVAERVDLSQALVSTGFGYDSARRAEQGQLIAGLLPLVRDIRREGSAALDLCFVAAGRYNAYFERGLNPWDHAAGALIAREAGAAVTGLLGAPPSQDYVISGHPDVAADLEGTIANLSS